MDKTFTKQVEKSEKKQLRIYSKLAAKHPHGPSALHWRSKETQTKRFAILSQIIKENKASLADIGCGTGDFFTFLKNHNFSGNWRGYEIVTSFAQAAKSKHPDVEIITKSPLTFEDDSSFDYLFASGLFAFGNRSFFQGMIQFILKKCTKGFAFNLHYTEEKKFFSLSPNKVIDMISQGEKHQVKTNYDSDLGDLTFLVRKAQ